MKYFFIIIAIAFGMLILLHRRTKNWTYLGVAITLGSNFLSLAYSGISLDTKPTEFMIAFFLMIFSIIVTYLFTVISIKDTINEKTSVCQAWIEKTSACRAWIEKTSVYRAWIEKTSACRAWIEENFSFLSCILILIYLLAIIAYFLY